MTDVEAQSEVGPAYKRRSYRPPLRTQGGGWGAERIRVGLSMRELERRSGVNRYILSFVEQGRMVPTGEEYDAVMTALRETREAAANAGSQPAIVRIPGSADA